MTFVFQPWFLAVVATVIKLASYLFAFVFAFLKRKQAPEATRYLLMAFGLLLVAGLGRTFVLAIVGRFYGAAVLGQAAIWAQVIYSIVTAISIGLFVAAAYVNRSGPDVGRFQHPTESESYMPGDQHAPIVDNNPFVPPR